MRLARAIVTGVVEALEAIGRGQAPEDPAGEPAGMTTTGTVSEGAVSSFLRGVLSESVWDRETARAMDQGAASDEGFFGASTALAGAGRLGLGGTSGESRRPGPGGT